MRKILWMAMLAIFTMPAFAAEATYTNVPVVDVACSKKAVENPDAHTRACAMQCQGSGYGIVTEDQKFLKLDANGNKKVLAELKKSDKKDHLRVDVSGDVEGDTLKVKSIKLL